MTTNPNGLIGNAELRMFSKQFSKNLFKYVNVVIPERLLLLHADLTEILATFDLPLHTTYTEVSEYLDLAIKTRFFEVNQLQESETFE